MLRSLRPCRTTVRSGGAASVSSAEPATVAALHPSPSMIRPIITTGISWAPRAVITAEPISRACPSTTVGSRPHRSERMPNSGESAYMPAMCRLMVKPTTESVAPPCTRCTGVMDISATIVA
jgi:hypothetical protein